MAFIGDTTVYIGSPDCYAGDDRAFAPVVDLVPLAAQFALNDTARLDASGTYTNDPLGDVLFYEWAIVTHPPQSAARMRILTGDNICLLTLDTVGPYFIRLDTWGANGGQGATKIATLLAQPQAAPSEGQQVHSTSWLWEYLPDVWGQLPHADRLRIETFWRGLQQLAASDVMQVLNTKDSLSVATIQDRTFRKWQKIDLRLDVSNAPLLMQEPVRHTLSPDNRVSVDGFLRVADMGNLAKLSLQHQFVGSGTMINPSTLLLDDVDIQPHDIAKRVSVVSGVDLRTGRIAGITQIGTRAAAVVSPPVMLQPYPRSVRVEMVDAASHALGIVWAGDHVAELGYTSTPARVSLTGDILDNQAWVWRATQLALPGAYALGVRAGDVLTYEIQTTLGPKLTRYADVAAVGAGYVAVYPRDTLLSVVEELVGLLTSDGAEDWVECVMADVQSEAWRMRNLRVWLGNDSLLTVCAGTSYRVDFRVLPKTIHRRSCTAVPDDVTSIFRLTERTERAMVDGSTLITEGGEHVTLTRDILDLYENADFFIRRRTDPGAQLVSDGTVWLTARRYSFAKSGARQGDTLLLTSGPYQGEYKIQEVNGSSVRVDREVPTYLTKTFAVRGGMTSRSLVFTNPLPEGLDALWAETVIVSNESTVDAQFGALAGMGLEDWVTRGLTNSYKDTVVGLYYARMVASTVGQIENAVSIISGIPFAPFDSVIREIDSAYETDMFGNPMTMRVLLEEIDADGTRTQRFSAHTFPAADDQHNDEFSGIAISPQTGRRYVIGDTVKQFTALALGAKVYDIYNTLESGRTLDDVIHRHRFRVSIDVDATSLRTPAELKFITDFVIDIKPAYVSFVATLVKFLVDTIQIEESITMRLAAQLYDNPYHHRGPANVLDESVPDALRIDASPLVPLTTWFPSDGHIVFSNNSAVLVSEMGGFLDPNALFHGVHVWPQPWLRAGDTVRLRSQNLQLDVVNVVSDTELLLGGTIPIELQYTELDGVRFFVGRYRTDVIQSASVETIYADDRLPLRVIGDCANDVGAGDIITLEGTFGASLPMRVLHVDRDPGLQEARVTTYPSRPLVAMQRADIRVFREQIVDRQLYEGALIPTRTVNARETFYRIPDGHPLALGIEPGDVLRVSGQQERLITCVTRDEIVAVPPVPRGTDVSAVGIFRTARRLVGDQADEHERAVASAVDVMVKRVAASLCRGIIRTDFPLRPGDLVYYPGALFDHGEGVGITRVMAILNNGRCAYGTGRAILPRGEVTVIRQAPLRWMYYTAPNETGRYGTWATQHWS